MLHVSYTSVILKNTFHLFLSLELTFFSSENLRHRERNMASVWFPNFKDYIRSVIEVLLELSTSEISTPRVHQAILNVIEDFHIDFMNLV